MAAKLDGRRIAVVVTNEGVEQIELTAPRQALEEAGAEVVLIAPKAGDVQAFNHLDKGDVFTVQQTSSESQAEDFDALVVCENGPGPIISSRKPDDLPDFCDKIVEKFAAAPRSA